MCNHCPVKELCLETHYLEQGIVVGGTTWKERLKAIGRDEVPEAVDRQLAGYVADGSFYYRGSLMGFHDDLIVRLQGRYAR